MHTGEEVPPPYGGGMDIRAALVVEQLWQPVPGGSGRYIVELARELPGAGVRPVGIAAREGGGSPHDRAVGLDMPVVRSRLPRRALYASWDRLHWPSVDPLAPRAQVVHATTWAIPPTNRPLVVTVHDTAFLRDPGHFTPHGVEYFTRALETTRRRADLVIVPSRATAQDCESAGIASERIRVIPHGVRAAPVTAGVVETFREARGLSGPYVLWVGTREPRKNLPTLLEAYREVSQHSDLDLVLVGPEGWGDDTAERALLATLPAGRVHVLGRLEDQDLDAAYAGARVFCFPSSWEGFGLPVLEAMARGVPVVTSRGTSMEEVTGPDAALIDPASVPEVAAGILEAAGPRHDELAAAGPVRAQEFTWARCARAHARAYGELVP